ncbi:MAG: hypothetical protein IIZ78_23980 [Clostridiales bacterium]|nr:hypothetical protein [Clostridiales bacterium]
MIKDLKDSELYFKNGKELINWLSIDEEIEKDMTLSLNHCEKDEDYVEFANEYILKENEGAMTHEFKIVEM